MSKKIRLGVFGCRRGISLANGALSNGMEIAFVCDRDEIRAKNASKKLGCPYVLEYEKLLEQDIDGVIVANYATEHAFAAKLALAAGKHVLSECMACFTLQEAVELVEAVEAAPNLVYFFAENYPFFVQNIEMKRLFESGSFGKFTYGEGEYVHPISRDEMGELGETVGHWRNWLPATYYCTHSIAPVMMITGTRPVAVNAIIVPHDFDDLSIGGSVRVNDGTSVILCKMDNGAAVKILPWSSVRDHGQRYRICCAKGSMEWNQGDGQIRISRWDHDFPGMEDKPKSKKYAAELPDDLKEALKHGHGGGDFFVNYWFKHAIVTGEKPLIDVYKGVDMSMIGIQGYRSALNNSNTFEIPDLRIKANRDKYRNDNWNPDPEKPCDNKPMPSVIGKIKPSQEALDYHAKKSAEYRQREIDAANA